jgi:hypothetical protein
VFDLAEDRLDQRLPPRVHRAARQGSELPGHAFAASQACGGTPARRGGEPLPMRLSAGGDVGIDAPLLQRVQVFLGAIARIRQELRLRRSGPCRRRRTSSRSGRTAA